MTRNRAYSCTEDQPILFVYIVARGVCSLMFVSFSSGVSSVTVQLLIVLDFLSGCLVCGKISIPDA